MRAQVWSVQTLQLDTSLSLAPPVDDWIKTGCCTRRETPKGFDPLRLMPESRQALFVVDECLAVSKTWLLSIPTRVQEKGGYTGPPIGQ